MSQKSSPNETERSRRIIQYVIIVIGLIVFLPLIFRNRFRQLVGLSLLGMFYSSFLVSTWERWNRSIREHRENGILGWIFPPAMSRLFLTVFPLKAWGMVPFVLQFLVLTAVSICSWFIGPVIYEVMRNPSTLGLLRDFFETATPELFKFVQSLISNPDTYQVLVDNAQQIFTSLNRFISAFVFPFIFILFLGIGAALYDSVKRLLIRAEDTASKTHSKILNSYSRLFAEFIRFNLMYYLVISLFIGIVLAVLDTIRVTDFGWKMILGVNVTFIAGNLIVPGLGTLTMTSLIMGLSYVNHGIIGPLISGGIFAFFFMIDDYAVKPWFLAWLGTDSGGEWEFGTEIIIFGFVILYAAFGIVGALLLFPMLCFCDAYLRHRNPELRPWLLHPISNLREPDQ